MLDEVLMVKVAWTEPLDGTVTDCGDHEALDPGTFDQFSAAGVTVPLKPPMLLKVTV